MKTTEEDSQEERSLAETNPTNTVISDFQPPGLRQYISLVNHPVSILLLWQPWQTNIISLLKFFVCFYIINFFLSNLFTSQTSYIWYSIVNSKTKPCLGLTLPSSSAPLQEDTTVHCFSQCPLGILLTNSSWAFSPIAPSKQPLPSSAMILPCQSKQALLHLSHLSVYLMLFLLKKFSWLPVLCFFLVWLF